MKSFAFLNHSLPVLRDVHSKIKICSSFTHIQVVLNSYEFILLNTKQDQKNLSMAVVLPQILQYIFHGVQQRKDTQTALDEVEDE